jgi:hypothetical protein
LATLLEAVKKESRKENKKSELRKSEEPSLFFSFLFFYLFLSIKFSLFLAHLSLQLSLYSPDKELAMGFINPGRSHKRKKTGSAGNLESKRARTASNKIILQSAPALAPLLETPSSSSIPPKPEEPPLSILEKLPLEILHEIFICSGISPLPFLNKRLAGRLKPSRSLVMRMLKVHHIHDLDGEIEKKRKELAASSGEADDDDDDDDDDGTNGKVIRYILDKDVFKYSWVTVDVLKQLPFDTVLPLSAIYSEMKNRLILYHDELNKKLLEGMTRDEEISAEEVNRTLARMAEERFALMTNDDNDNNDNDNDNDNNNNNNNNSDNTEYDEQEDELNVLSEDSQDFHPRFYNMREFDNDFMQMVEYLHASKRIKYTDGDKAIKNLITHGILDLRTLKKFLSFTKTTKILDVDPLIAFFKQEELTDTTMNIAHWIVDNFAEAGLINSSKLWEAAAHSQNSIFLDFLTSKGGVPTYESLLMINSF